MGIRKLLASLAFTSTTFAVLVGGASAEANPENACAVGVFVSGSAGPGFGQETAGLAQAGELQPAEVATASCRRR